MLPQARHAWCIASQASLSARHGDALAFTRVAGTSPIPPHLFKQLQLHHLRPQPAAELAGVPVVLQALRKVQAAVKAHPTLPSPLLLLRQRLEEIRLHTLLLSLLLLPLLCYAGHSDMGGDSSSCCCAGRGIWVGHG